VNSEAFHTADGCEIVAENQFGTPGWLDCDQATNYGSGCGVLATEQANSPSYGDSFNAIGGGVYAMVWDSLIECYFSN
jgi:hypothetical protein